MSAATVAHSRVALPALERLYEHEDLPLVGADTMRDELFLTTSPLVAGRSASGSRPALVEGVELLPITTVRCDLLTLRRAGSQLFSRYYMSSREREDS